MKSILTLFLILVFICQVRECSSQGLVYYQSSHDSLISTPLNPDWREKAALDQVFPKVSFNFLRDNDVCQNSKGLLQGIYRNKTYSILTDINFLLYDLNHTHPKNKFSDEQLITAFTYLIFLDSRFGWGNLVISDISLQNVSPAETTFDSSLLYVKTQHVNYRSTVNFVEKERDYSWNQAMVSFEIENREISSYCVLLIFKNGKSRNDGIVPLRSVRAFPPYNLQEYLEKNKKLLRRKKIKK